MQTIPEANTEPSISFLAPIGYQTTDCGYCKKQDQSASYYATSKELTVEHYQILVDRGWRRSGTLFYKPDVRHSCCPHYTIRLPAADFKPRKDQRQAVNRWNRHVLGDKYYSEAAKLKAKSKAEKARARNEFDLRNAIHESEYDNRLDKRLEPDHRFEVTLEPDDVSDEKFKLYKNYQIHVHQDPPEKVTKQGFTRFLCSSPLRRKTRNLNGKQQKLGSYHQCYKLDGRLIAMAVLDLLPHCVSGVYFIYHADFEKFGFGKISALREAMLALEGGYQYYYMGYYIHTCVKMRYKNDYKPQHVLDLETMEWNLMDEELLKLMDSHHYMSPSSIKSSTQSSSPRKTFDSAAEAVEAYENGMSLFKINLAGMISEQELLEGVDLDDTLVRIKKDVIVHARDFIKWQEWSIHDCGEDFSIKGAIAQLVACIGPEMGSEVVVSFNG